ncbi:MAG: HPr family phosphocarrier protein, partial [Clostridium sp.]|nr:HPr family phosphocarrier protein [Clostridium sp.]
MTSMLVKFEKPNQVVDFVNTISRYDYDADIKYGSHMVDAKSILGVLYLAVSRTVEL